MEFFLDLKRDENRHTEVLIDDENPLPPCNELLNYSSYFDWGMNSQGARQLSLAILLFYAKLNEIDKPEAFAIDRYVEFLKIFISHLKSDYMVIDSKTIEYEISRLTIEREAYLKNKYEEIMRNK
jgi:hypothetical protein